MTSPTWQTDCSSIATTTNECILPLLGTTGNIVNSTPQLQQVGSVTRNDNCITSLIKQTCDSDYRIVCDRIISGCPSGQLIGDCNCVELDRRCDALRCNRPFTCTRPCFGVNGAQSCPNGTLIQTRIVNGALRATCEYTVTPDNINLLYNQLPQEFMVPMAKRLALSVYLAAWMNELYINPQSFFHQSNYLQDTLTIKENVLSSSGVQRYAQYIPNWNEFSQFMLTVASYPTLLFQTPDVFRVILYLYNTEQNLSSEDMTGFIRGFTVEPQTGPTLSAPTTSFDAPNDFQTKGAYIITDLTNLNVYNNDTTDPTRFVSINDLRAQGITGDFYIVGRVFPTTIIRWSPNLVYLYSVVHRNLPYDKLGDGGFCDRILQDTGEIAVTCYNNTCTPTFTDQCRTYLETYCRAGNIYNSDFIGINLKVRQFLLNANAAQCQCYNSRLSPPLIPAGNRPAMCFTSTCTADPGLIEKFGLNDDFCGGFCDEVYQWITSGDLARASVNPNVLDVARYQRLCGALPQDVEERALNYYVLIFGIVLSFFVAGILLVITGKFWIALIPFILLIGLSVFSAFDLNGVPSCDNTDQVCKSRFTGISLPLGLCSYQVGCECSNYGGSCADGKLCLAGKCFDPPE